MKKPNLLIYASPEMLILIPRSFKAFLIDKFIYTNYTVDKGLSSFFYRYIKKGNIHLISLLGIKNRNVWKKEAQIQI